MSQADSKSSAHFTEAGSQQGLEYCQWTLQSLANIDEALVNYELLEALICRIIGQQDHQTGPQVRNLQRMQGHCRSHMQEVSDACCIEGCVVLIMGHTRDEGQLVCEGTK